MKHPQLKEDLIFNIKSAATVRVQIRSLLCHKCRNMYNDIAIHILLNCTFTEHLRDLLWCYVINVENIMLSVYLHALSDDKLIHILNRGNIDFNLSDIALEEFRICCVTMIHTIRNIIILQIGVHICV